MHLFMLFVFYTCNRHIQPLVFWMDITEQDLSDCKKHGTVPTTVPIPDPNQQPDSRPALPLRRHTTYRNTPNTSSMDQQITQRRTQQRPAVNPQPQNAANMQHNVARGIPNLGPQRVMFRTWPRPILQFPRGRIVPRGVAGLVGSRKAIHMPASAAYQARHRMPSSTFPQGACMFPNGFSSGETKSSGRSIQTVPISTHRDGVFRQYEVIKRKRNQSNPTFLKTKLPGGFYPIEDTNYDDDSKSRDATKKALLSDIRTACLLGEDGRFGVVLGSIVRPKIHGHRESNASRRKGVRQPVLCDRSGKKYKSRKNTTTNSSSKKCGCKWKIHIELCKRGEEKGYVINENMNLIHSHKLEETLSNALATSGTLVVPTNYASIAQIAKKVGIPTKQILPFVRAWATSNGTQITWKDQTLRSILSEAQSGIALQASVMAKFVREKRNVKGVYAELIFDSIDSHLAGDGSTSFCSNLCYDVLKFPNVSVCIILQY